MLCLILKGQGIKQIDPWYLCIFQYSNSSRDVEVICKLYFKDRCW